MSMPYGKVRKLLQEFPYLWGVIPEWSYNTTIINVERLDQNALLQVVKPLKNNIFYHICYLPRGGHPGWEEDLEEVRVDEEHALADFLRHHLTRRGPEDSWPVVDAILVLEKTRFLPTEWTDAELKARYLRPANGAISNERDAITIYKPPSSYRSIIPFFMKEMVSLREEKERIQRDQERLSVLSNA